jgi:nitroreductase
MQALESMKSRRSVRAFSGKEVPWEKIEALLECARYAPTARNVQPWEFVVVTAVPTLKKLGAIAQNGFFIAEAPCCIAVFCADTKYYLEDGCAATVNILTAAHALGLAACWVAGDKKEYCEQVREILAAPAGVKLVSLIPLGYAQEHPGAPVKRPLKEMIHQEKW